LDLNQLIAKEKEKLKVEMEVKLNALGSDLRKITTMYEYSAEQVISLEAYVKDLLKVRH
jgi:hypothetical protein